MESIRIGRYDIKSEIARGGMATVFHAYDPNFERDVALKVLPKAFLHDPQFRTRFDREAKMIALLEHPAIVPVYDFGEDDGQPYIVMRYMAGGDLTQRIEQGALSLSETAQIINRLAPALDAAHARGIIHRDLKPGNVLFDQYGNSYLSDFGIARLAQQHGATLTGSNIVGTPAYMSPEQVQGDKEIDGRSDLYALGVMIYQMLSGQAPYQSETPAKVMMMHVLHPVPSILDDKADIPPSINEVIQKAMAKDPDDRFSTTAEMATALENASRQTRVMPSSSSADTVQPVGAASASPSEMATALAPGKTVAGRSKEGAIPAEAPARAKIPTLAIGIVAAIVILAGVVGGLAFVGRQGNGPLAFLAPPTATATTQPTNTSIPTEASPSETQGTPPGALITTEVPTATASEIPLTPTETFTPIPTPVAIGGADMVAYLSDSDVWIANLDGSGLKRLTEDGTEKSQLQWTPDGQAVNYISGQCIRSVEIETTRENLVACFTFVQFLKEFEISPDGKSVAMSLDNQLYIIPYDLELLQSIERRSDLTEIAECADLAPYERHFGLISRWSRDGDQLALVIWGPAGEQVTVLSMEECTPTPDILVNFPPPHFRPDDYMAAPSITNLGWDGIDLFAFASFVRFNGFGNLHIFNSDLFKARQELNPINEACCYRDPIFSPDGSHLLFAFQQYPGGDGTIQLYMIPYGTIGTGVTYSPLPLPPITNSDEAPNPALRPVQ